MNWKHVAALLAVAVSLSTTAHAQTSGTNTVVRNGYYFNATTGQQTDVNGNALIVDADRDRNASVLTGGGINGVSIASGQSVQATSAIALASFGKMDMLLSWQTAAAADSDSVAIAVKVYGKISSSPGDGLNYLISPSCGCAADTATVVFPAGVAAIPRKVPPTFLVLSPNKVTGSVHISLKIDGTQRLHTVPYNRIRLSGGTNAVVLNLADVLGDFAFPYALVELSNWGATNLTNVTASWWPRAN